MGYLEDMQKHMRDAQSRLKKIEKLSKKLKDQLKEDKIDTLTRQTAEIVLLLVEQFEPLKSIPNVGGNLGNIKDIARAISGGEIKKPNVPKPPGGKKNAK